MQSRIQELVSQMTLEEKVSLTIGQDFWHTNGVERLGVPSITVHDGPSGLRKPLPRDEMGIAAVPATCFPSASALASSWDVSLAEAIGQAIADECQAMDVQVVLGPGVNIKRTPLGGRSFEYYSEDPVLAGEMGSAFVQGVQSRGVGTSLKHFACNNQEFERMTISAEIDARTLREIYLPAFERVVKKARPWTIMGAYNKINGTYACENPHLLRTILKKEWGYEGVLVSDWGAVNDKAKALAAGLDLEMPGRPGNHTEEIVQLVRSGQLAEAAIDEAAARMLELVFQAVEQHKANVTFDPQEHHALARKAAAESMVLLKNEHEMLPLTEAALSSVAIIGRFAQEPRYQGGGSAHVTATQVDTSYAELQRVLAGKGQIAYAEGYAEDGQMSEEMLQEAMAAAQAAKTAIVFVGLLDKEETEGNDRSTIDMSATLNRLVTEICRVQPATVVVLCNGSAIAMPWIDAAGAVLEAGLGGQAVGSAIVDVLLGKVNPSGKLAETFPMRLEDTPAYLNYPGEEGYVRYGEGLFVGYRYYDKKKIAPMFPFGYGLSYTTFEYTGLSVSKAEITDSETLAVTVTVRNSGARAGKEIVQLYVRDVESRLVRPVKELKAFAKVELAPGEEKAVQMTLEPRDFAYYDSEQQRWYIESGTFEVLVGSSSAYIELQTTVLMHSASDIPHFNKLQSIAHFLRHPKAHAVIVEQFKGTPLEMFLHHEFLVSIPLIKLSSFGAVSEETINGIVEKVNHAVRAR